RMQSCCAFLLTGLEDSSVGCRDTARLHELLGKRLVALQPRRSRARAKYSQSLRLKSIDDAVTQRLLRPDNGQIDSLPLRDFQQRISAPRGDVKIGRDSRRPTITGRAE